LTSTRSWAANNWNTRIRLKAENDRLRQELALVREEMRIKDSRMLRIPAQRRPHYPPTERLSILELRAARAWSLSQAARHLLITTATVASWMGRLDEDGSRALVQIRVPVNKFPELVTYMVQRLKVLCPTLGRVKAAQILSRAGLHIGATTIDRKWKEPPRRNPSPVAESSRRAVRSKRPDHIWHCDLSIVPTSLGLWAPWLPFALPPRWPFCWWIAVVVDHYSRRIMGFARFEQQPTSIAIRTVLGRALRAANGRPRHLITDRGTQFRDEGFREWCRRRDIRQRFGAVGKYGSIAVIERLIRSVKEECTRRLLVPYRHDTFRRELALYLDWYNRLRPHDLLEGAIPEEIYREIQPACKAPRVEPRRKWPRGSPCARPAAEIQGGRGARLELKVSFLAKRRHLPIVEIRRAA
jgi:transposase InsO family protein